MSSIGGAESPGVPVSAPTTRATSEVKSFLKNALLFVLVGLVLYLAVYAGAEQLVYNYGKRNRFFVVKTAPQSQYDYVILGASHAVALDYEDMSAQLQAMTGSRILNLSNVGAGIVPNRMVFDYFLAGHSTAHVIYIADSFAFDASDWNEDRLQDIHLYQRAPFDPALVGTLLNEPAARPVALDYTIGFSKINNADRFKPDITDDEATKFGKTYRPVKQIDAQRLAYLYPKPPDPQVLNHYLGEFEAFLRACQARGIRVVVVKPPVPERWYKMLPNEQQFDDALRAVLEQNRVAFHDFSLVANDEKYFYNTDHLNRAGVLNFFNGYLKQLMQPSSARTTGLEQ